MLESIKNKISQDHAISDEEAYFLHEKTSLDKLKTIAQMAKKKYHPSNRASYLVMSILNYTNICVAGCNYCAFYAYPHQKQAYLLTFDEVCYKIDDLCLRFNPALISFNGGFHPSLRLDDYAQLFEKIHHKYSTLTFFEMTIAEFVFVCQRSKLSFHEGARILKDSGTQWITGGGAEVLTDSFRKRQSPGKSSVKEYYDAQQAVIEEGLGTTATMVIGFDESLEERLQHLRELRDFQERMNHKVRSFLCWTYKPYNNALGGKEISNDAYLRWLAVSRIYLNNFKHIRTSVLTRNERAFDGLAFGADDFDLPIEDEVTQKAGATISLDFKGLLDVCKERGFNPQKREPFDC